jgi:hypothetical protein
MGAPRGIQLRTAWIPKGPTGFTAICLPSYIFFCTGSVTAKAAFLGTSASDCDRRHIVNAGGNPKTCIKRGDSVKSRFPLASFCIVFLCACTLGQTFDVNGQSTSPPGDKRTSVPDEKTSPGNGSTNQNSSDLGWGSSIDVARQARAAQDALKRNDYAAAVSFAERSAKSAPQNPELWFLLGYCARLEEHYPAAIDAYNRGLKIQPNSLRGMAGLAQTYAKMGRDADAEKLLQKIVDANPKDANSLQLAGELLLTSDPKHALELLR